MDTSKRTCFWIPVDPYDEGGFVPALITEGEPGYDLMAGNRERFQSPWYWGKTREQAAGIAAAENTRKGLTEQDVAEIVASSLAAQQQDRGPSVPDGPGLYEFEARQSDDGVKRDLELTHAVCGTHVCDIEPDDTLGTLISVAEDHLRECPGPQDEG